MSARATPKGSSPGFRIEEAACSSRRQTDGAGATIECRVPRQAMPA